MASMLTDALAERKRKAQEEAIRLGAQRRAMARMNNRSGGDIGGTIGAGIGAAGALASGNPGAIPAAMAVGRQVGNMAGKALDPDEDVNAEDVMRTTSTVAAAQDDKDAMKALKDLLGQK